MAEASLCSSGRKVGPTWTGCQEGLSSHTHTPPPHSLRRGQRRLTTSPHGTSLEWGRKLEAPEKSPADMGDGANSTQTVALPIKCFLFLFFSSHPCYTKTTSNKSMLFEGLLFSLVTGPLPGAGDSGKNIVPQKGTVTRTQNAERALHKT